ncbi:hypothetical protein [Pelomonas cellulosilytica]|uniref:Uncharacterized protein n=1 Tax=Pelomonas cellulosilytica TaxID=2906762 RepID=A0ABS8XSK5_9BURK|nr:hypothetical protein [Pelomonas sp. P8]MCE4555692.1 hypothetical protein [Pelomonas sp. P8]
MQISLFAQRASFPDVWLDHGLLVGPFFEAQAREFEREYESETPEGGTEHWRYGAFVHWLRAKPAEATVVALAEAALRDQDPSMAGNVILELAALPAFSHQLLEHVLARAPARKELGVAPEKLRAVFAKAHPAG